MEVTRFKTPKGKDAFSLDGYCFRVDKRSADGERVFLRCLDPSCTVRMETVGIHSEPTPRGQRDHTHAPNREESVRRQAEHDMREKAKSGTASIPAIYDEVAITVHQEQRNVALLIHSNHLISFVVTNQS